MILVVGEVKSLVTSGFSLENLWKSRKLVIGSLYAWPMISLPRASRTRPTLVRAASSLQKPQHVRASKRVSLGTVFDRGGGSSHGSGVQAGGVVDGDPA